MKIRASSLIEVVVALLIIMIVFASSTVLYVKIINSNPAKQFRLQNELLALANEIKENGSYGDHQYEVENGIAIFQYCNPYKADSLLLYLKLEAIEGVKTIAIHEEIFFRKKDDLY